MHNMSHGSKDVNSSMKHPTYGKECASAACKSIQYNQDGSSTEISFFKFPTKHPQRQRWCNLIKWQHGRDGFTFSKIDGDIYETFSTRGNV